MDLVLSILVLIFSAILHEVMHGYVADRLGDPTARLSGRLTLNPKAHFDPMMTLLVPAFLYIVSGGRFILGGAKPVPVDPFNLKEGRKDVAVVSLSGPLTNLALAVLASLVIKLLYLFPAPFILNDLLYKMVDINIMLGVFNLIPIPPLDGSKVFSLLLPEETAIRYLNIGTMGLVLLLLLLNMPFFGEFLGAIVNTLREVLLP